MYDTRLEGGGTEYVGYLTVLASPYKIRLALAAALFILLEAAYRDPIWVDFAAGSALDLECVVEWSVFCVYGAEVCHSELDGVSGCLYVGGKDEIYPVSSVVSCKANILVYMFVKGW